VSDRAYRRTERYDPVAALAWRLRFGEIDPMRVAYAAALGHPVALQVVEPAELPADPRSRVELGVGQLSYVAAVRWAADLAETAVVRATHGDDLRPASAIAAARAWADCPCREHAITAGRALEAATDAMREASVASIAAWEAADTGTEEEIEESVAAARAWWAEQTAARLAQTAARLAASSTGAPRDRRIPGLPRTVAWLAEALDSANQSGALTWPEVFAGLANRLLA